jgi:hypothetical protein
MAEADLSFDVHVDEQKLAALFDRAPDVFAKTITGLVEGGAIDVQRYMVQIAPVAVTGQYRGSIRYTMHRGDTISAEVGPTVSYAPDLEYGTKPHTVSAAAGTSLAAWAKQKGIDPYVVAAGIALYGTRPHPVVAPTYEVMQDPVTINIDNGISKLVQAFDNGSV